MKARIIRRDGIGRSRQWLHCALALGLLLLNSAVADSAHQAETALFWQISMDGRPAGYLLGTIHSEDPRVLDFSDELVRRISACDIYAMELVPDLPTLSRLTEYMHYQDGSTLRDHVGPEQYERVMQALSGYQIPDKRKEKMKIWAVMMTLSLPSPQTGFFMDFSLSLRAAGSGLRVTGLESLEEQLDFLQAMPEAHQRDLLDQALEDFGRVAELHTAMVDAYLSGDLAVIGELTDQQFDQLVPEIRGYFVDQGITARNHRMAAVLVDLLQSACVFAAVGALHLPGDDGLITLLRSRGYTLTPLRLPLNGLD